MVECDCSAQAVSHQRPGHAGRSFARPAHDQVQILVVVVEAVDMPAPPFRTAMAAAVELSHRDSARKQSPSHVAIESTIGAESVNREAGAVAEQAATSDSSARDHL